MADILYLKLILISILKLSGESQSLNVLEERGAALREAPRSRNHSESALMILFLDID